MTNYNSEEELQDTSAGRPHVVILGAGASLAAFPGGDRNGRKLPLMNDLVDVVGLRHLLTKHGIEAPPNTNFEAVYSTLFASGSAAMPEIEQRIDEYFSALQLPDHATIYDHLVLSLRDKDLIATFNWDPLLYQACHRNHQTARLPQIVYLHGSVAIGYCAAHFKKGLRSASCSVCQKPLTPSRLLYPTAKKNYTTDPFINAEWSVLRHYLHTAFLLTIFGYGAPASDKAAIKLMKGAWGKVKERKLEQIEIIDVKSESELVESWKAFIHTSHYDTIEAFSASWLGRHPRRSIEAAWQQFIEAKFIGENLPPSGMHLPSLQNWYGELIQFE